MLQSKSDRDEGRILGLVKESKCGRLRLKNLSKTILFNSLELKLVKWDIPQQFCY